MDVKILKVPSDDDWIMVKRLALGTVGKDTDKSPDRDWKKKILISEHSPIYTLNYIAEWTDIKSWIATHFVRHHVGVTPFVTSQRNDRQDKYDRDSASQDYPVTLRMEMNAMAIINISKKRLCFQAHKETRDAWAEFLRVLWIFEPDLVHLCQPSCVYRNGLCPEVFSSCGYNKTDVFKARLNKYISGS